jgi:hypothetical protein
LDRVIKSNSTAQVIPSAEVIAMEVLRQQHLQRIEQNGTSLIRENWTAQTVEADMIKDSGMAYREIGGGGIVQYFAPCALNTAAELQPIPSSSTTTC